MTLAPGRTLLHYEMLAPLGAGAMGEVWRARDSRLEREVAIKVLPPAFAEDEERLRRFEREARSVASLNHPCVAQIHDVDQVDDLCFLVLELVPGETLEERLARGPLPVDEALAVCARIADGLEAAHDAGIIHRDLKPANVRLTPDGQVKLLDFGLARPAHARGAGDPAGSDSVLSTEAGRLLGTPTYMAPEQARGRAIDRRVDVWAFGCVLYECLTARRAFSGESLSDVLAAVLEHEPDWSALPELPPPVGTLLRRCLVKDPRQRLRDVGEARLLLDDPSGVQAGAQVGAFTAATAGLGAGHAGATGARGASRAWLAMTSVALVAALVALALQHDAADTPAPTGPVHLSIEPPPGTAVLFSGDFAGPPVVSPDGTTVAFVAVAEGEPRQLWLRRLDEPEARRLPGTDEALFPFWSPDGRRLGYFTGSALRVHDLATGTTTKVTDTGAARGGTFTGDGRILYSPSFRSALSLVDADGGEPVPLTTLDAGQHTSHRWPSMIPGTDRFVFSAVTNVVGEGQHNGLYLGGLDGRPPQRLLASQYHAQVLDGWLLHVKDDTLLAQPFDLDRGELREPAIVLAHGLGPDLSTWHGQFSASPAGVLVLHRPSSAATRVSSDTYSWAVAGNRISFWTIEGRERTSYAAGTPMFGTALSPDGRTIAMDALSPDGFTDIWLHPVPVAGPGGDDDELEAALTSGPASTRLTFLPGFENRPVWSPDGTEVAFRWDGDDTRPRGIYRKRVGGGSETLVRDNHGEDDHASDWTPDGRHLVLTTHTMLPSDGNDIVAVPLDGGPDVPLVVAPGPQYDGHVSPDGRWLAYGDASTRTSIFVTAFSPAWPEGAPEGRWLVSENGGYEPRWSADGRELYYMTATGVLVAVDVATDGESFSASPPRTLFQTPWRLDRSYDPQPDDDGSTRGFLILDSDDTEAGAIGVVLGWQSLLEQG